jgi:hypothetical protein
MKTQVIIFDKPEPKKHSICYKTTQDSPAITSVYVMKTHLGGKVPGKIKVTV